MSEADVIGPFSVVEAEAEVRPVRHTQLEVIDGSAAKIGSPGSLSVFIARKGSGVLDEVRAAAAGDTYAAERLVERYTAGGPLNPPPIPDEALAAAMASADVFADFSYGGDVLNRGIFLPPGVDMVAAMFAYNGGRLASNGCLIVEHYREGSDIELDGVVVQLAPPLTAAERAALMKLPADTREVTVDAGFDCVSTTYWVVAAAVAIGFAAGTAATVAVLLIAAAAMAEDASEHLSDKDIADLDPSASAQKLLEIRRRVLRERFARTT